MTSMPKLTPPTEPAQLNLCLQWRAIPGEAMNAKLDFLEANGFAAVEIPSSAFGVPFCHVGGDDAGESSAACGMGG